MPTIIINGGAPLPGCPETWEQAQEVEKQLNDNKNTEEWAGPVWDFDCGFKLDYDGPILRISSRFYPPKTHYGPTWDGATSVYILDKKVAEKKFDCSSLEELKIQVEAFVESIRCKIEGVLKDVV